MTFFEATTTATTGLLASGGMWVFAQAEAVKEVLPEGASTVLAGMTGGGFCIWYAYYVTKVLLPQKDTEHRLAVKELTDKHADTIQKLVDDFSAHSKRESEDHERDIQRIIAIYRAEQPADALRPLNR